MAKAKLLFILVIIFIFRIFPVFGEDKEDDIDWQDRISKEALKMNMEHLKGLLEAGTVYGEDYSKELQREGNTMLKVFVSGSMPINLLKNYAREAQKYDGVLVFKGLPGNSFPALSDLVAQVQGQDIECAMQVDDEAFERYSIDKVPAIVLSREPGVFADEKAGIVFDKITGNVGIRFALEQFRKDGDLKESAEEFLRGPG